jgi:hypothetical protein
MAEIKLQWTSIVERTDGSAVVEMLLADTESIDTAREGLLLRMAISPKEPKALVQLQQDALSRAQSLLAAEIQARREPVRHIAERY